VGSTPTATTFFLFQDYFVKEEEEESDLERVINNSE